MRRFASVLVLCLIPLAVCSADAGISRRDGFLMIWEGIRRDPDPTRETTFRDVPDGDKGSEQITYAKARGLIDDGELFHPDDPLLYGDAALWLLRTRNVADLDNLTTEALPKLIQEFPFIYAGQDLSAPVASPDTLLAMASSLDTFLASQEHEVSLYSEKFQGKGTACGEPFDMNALTAAHRTFPCNTLVKVTNVENNESVIVRINDRGPYVEGRDMDLSLAAFTRIAPRSQGVMQARFERLGDTALIDACDGTLRRYQKRITRDVRFDRGVPNMSPVGVPVSLTSVRPFVVRSITYPDGTAERIEDWVNPGEVFSLTPSQTGQYLFRVGTVDGHVREMQMDVLDCAH